MPAQAPKFSIILAAGKGTRMGSASVPKVCFPVDGVPAINRAIETYNACGIDRHIVVIGAMAGQVVETVGAKFDNAAFTFQAEQLGTAHATRVGLGALATGSEDPAILLVAGDRLIEPTVLEQLFDIFFTEQCDLALLACPRRDGSSQGRIVTDAAGNPIAIVEMADVRQRIVMKKLRELATCRQLPSRGELRQLMERRFFGDGREPDESKLKKAFGGLWDLLAGEGQAPSPDEILAAAPEQLTCFRFDSGAGEIVKTPEEVRDSPLVNNSVYVTRASALRWALARLDRNNAQGEEYLSAAIEFLAARGGTESDAGGIRALQVSDPSYVLGFNDPAELLEVEAHIQARSRDRAELELSPSRWYRKVSEWQAAFAAAGESDNAGGNGLRDELVACYSDDAEVLAERRGAYREVLDHAAGLLGPEQLVFLVRSPGRVNVMGRHIDHQGGNCNLITFGYETLMVVGARADDRVRICNVDGERFGDREFSIGEMIADLPWDDWLSLVNSEKVSEMVHTYGGDWSQYVMAAVLRLQKKFNHLKLRGMDLVVGGNVPMAAGLSSSSSLVVGAAEATIAVNGLDTFPAQLIDLCGEGEWFVGTRGGAADHAAVKLGQKGKVIKVTFFDFAVQERVLFPADYVLAVCDSGVRAQKSANAKDQFNHRISCYRLGFLLIKKLFPQYAPLLEHLRDVSARNLRVPLGWIYRILLHLPEQATRDELRALLPGEDLDPFFAAHQPPADGLYPIRGVVLFGLAEMERARLYADYLKENRISQIGRIMNTSHNGDRVSCFAPDGSEEPYRAPDSNTYLLDLMEDLESGNPDRVNRAQLEWQPGGYGCSLPVIDKMVDISLRSEGVAGAQLAGAGLGGCMMVFTRRESVQELRRNLHEGYYQPADQEPNILICTPIAGSGVLLKPD
jgi:N-acetylgalactosamine kinase